MSMPAMVHQSTDTSTAAPQQDTSEPQLHEDSAQTQPGQPGTAHAANQGGQSVGSLAPPKRARLQEPTHSQDLPATQQSHPPSLTELQGAALLSSPHGEQHACLDQNPPPHSNARHFLHLRQHAKLGASAFIWQNALQPQGLPAIQAHTLYADAVEEPAQQQETAHAQEPGTTAISLAAPAQLRHSSGRCSMQTAMSSGGFPEASIAV